MAGPQAKGWFLDVPTVRSRANAGLPGRAYLDLEIWFPGTGQPPMHARLEDVPNDAELPVDPTDPPDWALRQ